MLHELNISNGQFDEIIKPHADFLDLVDEKEQIEWSEVLMRKHPELLAFRTSIRNLIKPRDAISASVYALTTARTFLTCQYLLVSVDKSLVVGPEEVKGYATTMVNELKDLLKLQRLDPITDIDLRARTQFFAEGAYPPSAVSWMANFFSGNASLALNFLLPENSYPQESEKYMYRGILDIAYPIESALRKKEKQSEYPLLLPVKI